VSLFDIRRRDCLAREGTFSHGALSILTPGIIDIPAVFPDLDREVGTNVPLSADPAFVSRYRLPVKGKGSPAVVHPLGEEQVAPGDLVVVANWHTVLSRPRDFVRHLAALKEMVPPDTAWYAPASALPSNAALLVYAGFDLFDCVAADLAAARGSLCLPEGVFPAGKADDGIQVPRGPIPGPEGPQPPGTAPPQSRGAPAPLDSSGSFGPVAPSEPALPAGPGICGCGGCIPGDLRQHNRLALDRELALVRRFIEGSRLRELIEARCRSDPHQVAILRLLDGEESLVEPRTPITRSVPLIATTSEALRRTEVVRFGGRVVGRSLPPIHDVAVLLPCSARKPYSTSLSHRRFARAVRGRAHELIVTSPLGLVPRELERVYPAAHYDVPVTGHWDREELALISAVIAGYLARHPYRRVLAHLDGGALDAAQVAADACGITLEVTTGGGHPTDPDSLGALDAALDGERRRPTDMVRGVLAWQFGATVDTRGMSVRGRPPQERVERGGKILFTVDAGTGILRPTFEGWALIPDGYRVHIDAFTPKGDILAPGITSADGGIREGDEVLVLGEGVAATGRAAMGGPEMLRSRHGVAVRVRKLKSE
jgi:archaeosine synthase